MLARTLALPTPVPGHLMLARMGPWGAEGSHSLILTGMGVPPWYPKCRWVKGDFIRYRVGARFGLEDALR
jgi:hypothetical protein